MTNKNITYIKNAPVLSILNFSHLSSSEKTEYSNLLDYYLSAFSEEKDRVLKIEFGFNAGVSAFILGRYHLSIRLLRHSVGFNSRLVLYLLGLCYYNLAKVIVKSGKFELAKIKYNKSLYYYRRALKEKQDGPDDFQIYYALQAIYYELEDYSSLSIVLENLVNLNLEKNLINTTYLAKEA